MKAAPSSGRTDAPDAGKRPIRKPRWHLAAAPLSRGENYGQIRNCLLLGLRQGDLFGLQALGTLLHDKGHARAFVEGSIPTGFDSREMHEHIFAVVALDKSKAFSGIKPLNCTCLFHVLSLLLLC